MSQPEIEPDKSNPGGQEPSPQKPWGDDANFDPEKAWKLITDLRAQKNDPVAQRELQELREKAGKFDEAERAKMSEIDRYKTSAGSEKERADKAETTVARLRAAIKHGLTEAQAARLSGTTPEEIMADGEAYAKEIGITPAADADDEPPADEKPPAKDITSHHRPTQQPEPATPRGGRTPAAEPEEDLSEIIASIPR